MATIHYREITIVSYVGGWKTLCRQNMFHRSSVASLCCHFDGVMDARCKIISGVLMNI